jgi:alkylhydroperoxidase/carboxymuconolactone decarboxylase family protein YurZ
MAISESARKNHDELFPGHVSALAVTDPELIEVFDNFAFDEVLRHSDLDARTRLMVQLAALIGAQALSEYRVMLGAALTIGVTPVEAREIVYQAVPYAGMGKAFDFLHATNQVLAERGVTLPLEGRDPQVRSHVAANLRVGNTRQTLLSVLTVLVPFIGYPRTLNALAAINDIAPATAEGQ